MNELQVLREVRSLLETSWHRGSNQGRVSQRYCLVGGINKVTGVNMELTSHEKAHFLPWGRKEVRAKVLRRIEVHLGYCGGHIEGFNDTFGHKSVLRVLDDLIAELDPKDMEIGTPEKEYTVEPAEPVPGIKESPAPTPEPVRREPVTPEREKVPA